MRRLLEWVSTVPFLVLFGICLVLFDLLGRIVRPLSLRGFEVVMASLQWSLMSLFGLCGTRVEVERSPNVRPRTGYAVIANHQSLFDIAAIGGLLFSNFPKYVAKKELGRWIPAISLNLTKGGNALIDRSEPRQALRAIKELGATAQRRGVSVVIFPEGTRSKDGRLQPYKRAGAETLLAAADRLPVVPLAIDGSWRLHRMLPVPFGTRVRIRIGDPIEREPGDAREVLERAWQAVSATIQEWRAGEEPAPG